MIEAGKHAPGVNSVSADAAELMVDVETSAGKTLAIDDPALIDILREGIDDNHHLSLMRSERAMVLILSFLGFLSALATFD